MIKNFAIILALSVLFCSCIRQKDTLTLNGIKFEIEGDMDKGIAKSHFENGNIKAIAELSKGLLNGKYEEYYDNGKLLKSYKHLNGKIDGPSKTYYKNGTLFEDATYSKGYSVGKTTRYNYDGSKTVEIIYRNNEMASLTEYNKGAVLVYKLGVTQSGNTYQLAVTPEPKSVSFYIKKGDDLLRIEGNSFRKTIPAGEHIEFVAKGVSQYDIPFMFSVVK